MSLWEGQGLSTGKSWKYGGWVCPHRIVQTLEKLDVFVQRVHFGLKFHLGCVGCICILSRGPVTSSTHPSFHQPPASAAALACSHPTFNTLMHSLNISFPQTDRTFGNGGREQDQSSLVSPTEHTAQRGTCISSSHIGRPS